MTAQDKVLDAGHEDVILIENPHYDDALVGVTTDGRAVYDFDKMVAGLMAGEGWSELEAIEWIEYNTIRALPYAGPNGPVIMRPV